MVGTGGGGAGAAGTRIFSLAWEDMTSWGALWDVFLRAVQNPVVLLAAAVSVFNAVTDPTTAGVGDSRRALGYKTPNRDK